MTKLEGRLHRRLCLRRLNFKTHFLRVRRAKHWANESGYSVCKKNISNPRQSGIKPYPFQTQTYGSSLFPISGHKTQTDKRSKTTPFGPEPRGWGVLPTMAFTGKLRPKAVPFSGFKYMKGWGFPVADSGEGPGARPPSLIFGPK